MSVSDQSENENTTQQLHKECSVDNDVEDQTRPTHDDGGVVHENERATQEQPLLDKSEDSSADLDHSDGGSGVVDLPFSDQEDESIRDTVEDLEDTTQDKPIIEKIIEGMKELKKVYRKIVLPCGGVEYYLSWAKCPSKNTDFGRR